MAAIKGLVDEYAIINEACKVLPTADFKLKFLLALAELEDNNAHKNRLYPKTRMHKVTGIKKNIYRADIDKISGWRIHLQFVENKVYIKDIIGGQNHDEVIKMIHAKHERYS